MAEAVFLGLLFSFLPAVIDGLTALNPVVPNATSTDQFSEDQLTALSLAAPSAQQTVIDVLGNSGTGISFPTLAALLFGALTITTEYRRGWLTSAVLAEPRRVRLLLQKLATLTITAVAVAVLITVLRGLILFAGIAIQDETLLLSPAEITGFAVRGAITLMLYTWIGFADGLLVRSPVAAILTLGAAVAVESIARPITTLAVGTPNPAQYLPLGLVPDISGTNPLTAINGASMTFPEGIGTLPALLTLLTWSLVALSITTLRFCRTDIPALA
ncbi:MAG: hypothetical protein ACK5KU_04175 [Beutenbergiaceae bacterium]